MKFFVFLFLFFWVNGYSLIFINSIPMKADVTLNGRNVGKTPLLLKEDLTGPQKIILKKDFYLDSEMNVTVNSKMTNVYQFLAPTTFSIYFPQDTDLVINDQRAKSDHIKNIPGGIYEFNPLSNALSVKRVNPNKTFFYFSIGLTAVGLGTGILGLILANNAYNAYQNSKNFGELTNNMVITSSWDAISKAGFVMAGAGAACTAYFFVDDLFYNSRNQEIILKDKGSAAQDKDLYDNAMDYMSKLEYTNALKSFNQLIDNYNDSQYMPISLLRRAIINKDSGNNDAALKDLKKLQTEYPIYEIYEMTLKNLGDAQLNSGNYMESADAYLEDVDFSKSYRDYDLELDAIKALSAGYSKQKDERLMQRLKKLVQKYNNNPSYPDEKKKQANNLLHP